MGLIPYTDNFFIVSSLLDKKSHLDSSSWNAYKESFGRYGLLADKSSTEFKTVDCVFKRLVEALHVGCDIEPEHTVNGLRVPSGSLSSFSGLNKGEVVKTKKNKFWFKYGTRHLEGLNWEAILVNGDLANAGTYFNGRVVIFQGLVSGKSEHEIAAVLGHEIGHNVGWRRSVEHLRCYCYPLMFAILPKYLFIGFFVLHLEITKLLSHRIELECDRIGLMLMASAGYDPQVAPSVYRQFPGSETHPTGEKRARKVEEAMEKAVNIYKKVRDHHNRSVSQLVV